MTNRHRTERQREDSDESQHDRTGERGHHPADERHTNEYGNAADRDRERRQRKRGERGTPHSHHEENEWRGGHDETGHGHANRWGSNRTTDDRGSESGRAGRSERTHSGRSEREGRQSRKRSGREGHDTGSSRTGSQRGSHREQGISGRMTGQRGESTRHSDPRDSTFREGDSEHRHGGEHGTSERDRRFGSRRGHGSERRTGRRHSSE